MPTTSGQVAGRNHGNNQRLMEYQRQEPTLQDMEEMRKLRERVAAGEQIYVGRLTKERYRLKKRFWKD